MKITQTEYKYLNEEIKQYITKVNDYYVLSEEIPKEIYRIAFMDYLDSCKDILEDPIPNEELLIYLYNNYIKYIDTPNLGFGNNLAIRRAPLNKQVEIVELLLKENVDPTANGYEAIMNAIKVCEPTILQLLLNDQRIKSKIEKHKVLNDNVRYILDNYIKQMFWTNFLCFNKSIYEILYETFKDKLTYKNIMYIVRELIYLEQLDLVKQLKPKISYIDWISLFMEYPQQIMKI